MYRDYCGAMSNIEQNDHLCVEIMLDHGTMTARELMRAHPYDQFTEDAAVAWLASALRRGMIEVIGGSGRSTRYDLTHKGRDWRG